MSRDKKIKRVEDSLQRVILRKRVHSLPYLARTLVVTAGIDSHRISRGALRDLSDEEVNYLFKKLRRL